MAKRKSDEWLKEENLNKITEWKKHGLTEEQIANNMGIAYSSLQEWKKTYPDILGALKKGDKEVIEIVENQAMKLMQGYDYHEEIWERISDDRQKERHKGDVQLTQKEWEFALKYFDFKCAYCDISGVLNDPPKMVHHSTKEQKIN